MLKVFFDRYTSISPETISIVERELNIWFPEAFRDMIQKYNGGRFNEYICFKEFNEDFAMDRLLNFDKEAFDYIVAYNQPCFDHYIKDIIFFATTTDGSFIGFDYRFSSDKPSIILRLKDDEYLADNEVSIIASSFLEFLNMLTLDKYE